MARRLRDSRKAWDKEVRVEPPTTSKNDETTSNETAKEVNSKKATKDAAQRRAEFATVLALTIKETLRELTTRKKMLTGLEKLDAETSVTASILPAEAPDRFLRAETTIERRMYRALVMLLALRSKPDGLKTLP